MDLLPKFQHTLGNMKELRGGETIVLGVSGGADSLALLHLFARSRQTFSVNLHVVHVDHQLRGEEAQAEAQFVASVAALWDVPCHIEQVDVPSLAGQYRLSIEDAARRARYTILSREAARIGATLIAVAHNADDQAETVLMHLIRGSGLAGLRGMLPVAPLSERHLLRPSPFPEGSWRNILLIRPLLGIARADIEVYCAEYGLEPRVDRSNLDTTYVRNRLRHDVIPLLEKTNPAVKAALCRTASVLASDYEIIRSAITEAWQAIILQEDSRQICLDRVKWQALPLALQRGTLRLAAQHLLGEIGDIGLQHIDEAVRIGQSGQTGAQVMFPAGLTVRVDYKVLVIAAEEDFPPPDWPLMPRGSVLTIEKGREYILPGSAWSFSLSDYNDSPLITQKKHLHANPWIALLAAAPANIPIQLRTRQPGDRFHPQGAGGTQKLSDFMINVKIPAIWRDRLPILVVGDHIAWLCGWRVDEHFTIQPETAQIWLARFERHIG